jgi:glycosyltransferase involved in cell wall biosynthesis
MTPRQRILFVANDPPGRAVYRYRCEHLAEVLQQSGADAEVVYVGQPRVRVQHDIVVLHRICQVAEGRAFVRAARACGAVLVYGTDDLIFEEDAFGDGEAYAKFRRYAPLHRQMLQEADRILVSTDFLASKAKALTKQPVLTVRNFLSEAMLRVSAEAAQQRQTRRPGQTLAYLSGSATHDADLALIAEPLRQVLLQRPQAELLLVGPVALPAALEPVESQIRRRPFVSWQELPGLMASEVDVNLAPLDLSRPFAHAKSEIKWLEAAAVGVPTLTSNGAGFAELLGKYPEGHDYLVDNEWASRMGAFLEDPEKWGERARRLRETRGGSEEVVPAFAAIRSDTVGVTTTRRGVWVNWPVAPPKYFVKSALGLLKR